jgi:hypothetical protein
MPWIPIPIQRFTATATDDLHVTYECPVCGAVSEADVITSSAVDVAMPFRVGEGLRDDAARGAVASLPEAARQHVGLAGCPKCAALEPSVVRTQRINSVLGALASGTGVAAAVFAIFTVVIGAAAEGVATQVATFAVAALVVAAALGFGGRERFAAKTREARSRVTWAKGDSVSAPESARAQRQS